MKIIKHGPQQDIHNKVLKYVNLEEAESVNLWQNIINFLFHKMWKICHKIKAFTLMICEQRFFFQQILSFQPEKRKEEIFGNLFLV